MSSRRKRAGRARCPFVRRYCYLMILLHCHSVSVPIGAAPLARERVLGIDPAIGVSTARGGHALGVAGELAIAGIAPFVARTARETWRRTGRDSSIAFDLYPTQETVARGKHDGSIIGTVRDRLERLKPWDGLTAGGANLGLRFPF